jgi:hypothetical protein
MSKEMREQIDRVKNWKRFLNENVSITKGRVENIKTYLVNYFNHNSWESFVDSQIEGDCQEITEVIKTEFDFVKRMSGQMDVCGEDSEYCMYHYWVEFDNKIFDFAKGTLYEYVDWDGDYFYNPYVLGDDWKLYKPF